MTLKCFKVPTILFVVFLSLVFTSCENNRESLQQSLTDYDLYVQERQDSLFYYRTHDWNDLNDSFELKFRALTKDTHRMTEEMKASYYRTRDKWNTFQAQYEVAREEQKRIDQMDSIRARLALPGVRSDYTDLSATNVRSAYEHFVEVVKQNKDAYTKEEWIVVNVNWKALNGRKREVEADIPSKDKAAIVKLQLEYTGVKAVNRPLADNP